MLCITCVPTIVTIILILTIKKSFSWVDPRIAVHRGFANINDFSTGQIVDGSDLIAGQPYTLDIQMPQTDRYDYLLQRCTYNNKYNFIDHNSCLIDDKYFQYKWENDQYQRSNTVKRTFIHFVPPEPLVKLDCSVRLLECCGCAEEACGRNILPYLDAYPQQTVHLTLVNTLPTSVGILGASVANWPWWVWLLIALLLLLLLCFVALLFFLCARRRKVVDSESIHKMGATKQTQTLAAGTSRRSQDLGNDETLRHTAEYRTPSESLTGSIQSTTSHSKSALLVKQKKTPPVEWAGMESKRHGVSEAITREERSRFERTVRPGGHHKKESETDDFRDLSGLSARTQSRAYQDSTKSTGHYAGETRPSNEDSLQVVVNPHHQHQQTTSEEKFFKRSDYRGDVVEEGYDQALLSYSSQPKHCSHSAIV